MNASGTESGKGGRLTTHVLDTANGRPAAAMEISLFKISGDSRDLIKSEITNADGRCDETLLQNEAFEAGEYELVFNVGRYYSSTGINPFLGTVPIRFGVSNAGEHYHVPLLVSPFGYSTYRGS